MTDPLPIDDALPDLIAALAADRRAVLVAPPGAGKTTRVPLALLDAGAFAGRLVMLEPRRLAARAAAERMAETLGEPVGRTVGYRIRGDTRVSAATRIEVVTEGVLTRMIQSDADLPGVGAVVFDEFHERSLNADLGLALVWEIRGALRPDLAVLVMSATLDAGPVAALMDAAPVVTSQGRSFPVETRWLDRPVPKDRRWEDGVAGLVAEAANSTEGGILVFLPGAAEIHRTAARLAGRLPADCQVRPLIGAMPFAQQRAAIAPATDGRKVVLATAIAETSLTIEDIRVVVDGGRARRARFDPCSGMGQLVTERVSRAEADQRRGRAGRVAPGRCFRFWTRGEEGALALYPPAEIEVADLAGLALELALWGVADPARLAFLTPPGAGPYAEAQALLRDLGALDSAGRITGHGRVLAALPLHPRLAHMLAIAGPDAAPLAALMSDRDPLRGAGADLGERLKALAGDRAAPGARDALERLRAETRRLRKAVAGDAAALTPAQAAALAYPDRVGLRRAGDAPRWVLSGGKGVAMDPADPLAATRLLVATDLSGDAREPRIRLALALSEAELRDIHGDAIGWHDACRWSRREGRVVAQQQERFGALVLAERVWRDVPAQAQVAAMLDGVRQLGLGWRGAARRFRDRAMLVRAGGAAVPDLSDAALLGTLEHWLAPGLTRVTTAAQWKAFDLLEPLREYVGWDACSLIDRTAPAYFTTSLGRRLAIDYSEGQPAISVRLQEMFGLTTHPEVGPQRLPLKITLLSPAGRAVQVTTDLPGFWASSYAEVRKDMRGRYPKHPWPEDPTAAAPTLRAKPRRN